MQGLDQTAQRLTEFTSSVMSIFIFLAMVGAVFAIFSTIRAYNRGEADESQKQRSIIVGILIITLYYIARLIYLYRLSKDTCKMFKSYVGIVNKYFIKGKPMKDSHVKAFVVDNELTNPLDPEDWNKNAAKYFTERII